MQLGEAVQFDGAGPHCAVMAWYQAVRLDVQL